jgi:hypothetical protein
MRTDRSNRAVITKTVLDIHRYICSDWFDGARLQVLDAARFVGV